MPNSDNIHIAKFKVKAKSLLKSVKVGEPATLRKIEPYFHNSSDFKLAQAQLVIARTHHCNSWKALTNKDWLQCTFCKKWQYEIAKLIAGPDVYVCNECVELCNDILREEVQAS